MLIDQKMKMADVVLHDPTLVPIINRFGIHLGFGDRTIEEICEEHQLHLQFFVTILNAFHDKLYFPTEQLQSFKASLLIDYLQTAHRYFLDQKTPEIAAMIEKTIQEDEGNKKYYDLIKKFFNEYLEEFSHHIEQEDQVIFPHVLELEKALDSGIINQSLRNKVTLHPIAAYEAEHEDVEAKIFDLKNIIIRYLPTPKNDHLWYQILREIFTLEKELAEHARIEDMILIPKVEAMEKTIRGGK
ncbi:MAG: hemerythrin domain-containing protein [Bacteroidales bacterium]|nr:hemerythrin domain-containing protein [Bacteroidales bacterium]